MEAVIIAGTTLVIFGLLKGLAALEKRRIRR